jgi:hypothetical protein
VGCGLWAVGCGLCGGRSIEKKKKEAREIIKEE